MRKTRRHSKKTSVDATATSDAQKKTRSKRATTTTTTNTIGMNGGLLHGHEEEAEAEKRVNGSGNGVAAGGVTRKKIDWEIPRKTLHSSIGAFHSIRSFVCTLGLY
jgi:hypothetical protein